MSGNTDLRARELIAAIYRRDCVGCCLHVVIDDGNTSDSCVAHCAERAADNDCAECKELAELLLAMSEDDRERLVSAPAEPDPDVLERMRQVTESRLPAEHAPAIHQPSVLPGLLRRAERQRTRGQVIVRDRPRSTAPSVFIRVPEDRVAVVRSFTMGDPPKVVDGGLFASPGTCVTVCDPCAAKGFPPTKQRFTPL